MSEDIEELTFANLFRDQDGSIIGGYSGDVVVDFTTNTVLSGRLNGLVGVSAVRLEQEGSRTTNITLSYDADGSYVLAGADPSGGTVRVDFTGRHPTTIDYAFVQGSNANSPTDTRSDDTDGTTPDERPISVTRATPSVAFDLTTAGFRNGMRPVLTGTVSKGYGPVSVEIYDGATDLGAATVRRYGRWTFGANLGTGDYAHLTAVVTASNGTTATATAPYDLVTGVRGAPYRALEYDDATDGSTSYKAYGQDGTALVTATTTIDGGHTIESVADGQRLYSIHDDVMTGGGSNEQFVFFPHFGQDEITDFRVAGAGHDVVDLTNTQFHTLAEVLHHTVTSHGSAEIQVNRQDSITLDGVTKAELKAHRNDFLLG